MNDKIAQNERKIKEHQLFMIELRHKIKIDRSTIQKINEFESVALARTNYLAEEKDGEIDLIVFFAGTNILHKIDATYLPVLTQWCLERGNNNDHGK